ncbi:hypothetical protein D3C80_359630 [compost metagenome]
MRSDHRGANALCVIDDRFALGTQFLNQTANAHLVVAVAAFECVDFRVDEHFQLGCTRDRTLDALVHGRDFAAYGLADAHDPFRCDGFRLGQAKGDLSHGAGSVPEILRTGHHNGESEEKEDGDQDADGKRDQTRSGQNAGNRCDLPQRSTIDQLTKADTGHRPENGDDQSIADRATNRAAVQRAHNRRRVPASGIVGRLKGGLARRRLIRRLARCFRGRLAAGRR